MMGGTPGTRPQLPPHILARLEARHGTQHSSSCGGFSGFPGDVGKPQEAPEMGIWPLRSTADTIWEARARRLQREASSAAMLQRQMVAVQDRMAYQNEVRARSCQRRAEEQFCMPLPPALLLSLRLHAYCLRRLWLCRQVALRHQNFKHQRRKRAKKAAEGLLDDGATAMFAPSTPMVPARGQPMRSAHEGGAATLPTGGHSALSMQQGEMHSSARHAGQMRSEPRRSDQHAKTNGRAQRSGGKVITDSRKKGGAGTKVRV